MKRTIVIIAALVLLAIPRTADAQKHRSYVIGFYNLENLFDTYHDEGKNDYEYLPDGANEWTDETSWAYPRLRTATSLSTLCQSLQSQRPTTRLSIMTARTAAALTARFSIGPRFSSTSHPKPSRSPLRTPA